MTMKTCLLVSDDPDDHIEFTEALYEISDRIVVLVVADAGRAAELVLSKRHIPDYFIVDLAVNGFTHDNFFSTLEADKDFEPMYIVAYGDYPDYENVKKHRISAFLERDSAYSDIKTFMRRVLRG